MKFSLKIVYVLCLFIASIVGVYLMSFITGEINYSAILGGLVGTLILFIYVVVSEYQKSKNIAVYDERSMKVITTYVALVSPILFVIFNILLIVFLFLGITVISVKTLFIFPMVSLIIIGIGGLLVNKLY
ncbi:hypothetical protein [Bacillus cereus]|uniref:hypothetical protein n=1 Tax=Bacillus cereus TaxID=1396 RepID=UPI000BEE47B0|nr:hypothetical protein [Bacillus cereus]PDY73540.1 hypothetical protein CON10_27310 [Bacillus cereus]PEC90975.1 hypothetical protein CON02_11995 [Bacillus cereus]PET80850.1 hypothetical protein CN530_19390 [Bacillus cereus]PEX66774.1 hypothetical protein CN460_25325 [Bacillus cereus]PFI88675.1 hypothetical protein COI80_29570 [Bacillus cereus]